MEIQTLTQRVGRIWRFTPDTISSLFKEPIQLHDIIITNDENPLSPRRVVVALKPYEREGRYPIHTIERYSDSKIALVWHDLFEGRDYYHYMIELYDKHDEVYHTYNKLLTADEEIQRRLMN